MSSLDTYRDQQGLTGQVSASDADPQLVDWIKQASAATGADPVALLATSLQESGGHLNGPAGDGGTSFGPFQFHIGGALGTHKPAWASTYAAVLNRAQEFARYRVRGGVGAAAVQRPKDRTIYAQGVNSLLAKAHAILEGYQGAPSTTTRASVPAASTAQIDAPAITYHAKSGPAAALEILNAKGPSGARMLFQNEMKAYTVPAQHYKPAQLTPMVQMGGTGAPAASGFKLIGLPNQGTHTLYGNWESDNAIDIAMPAHTPVYATENGTIGSQFGHIATGDAHMVGQRLHLDGQAGSFYYQHLATIVVKPGQQVRKGQLLGYSGATNHVHFAVEQGDPRSYYR